jgi:SNF2 family DNA or RNA helicase
MKELSIKFDWPLTFVEAKTSLPIGLVASNILEEPCIVIRYIANRFSASIAACINKNNKIVYISVVRDGANYVVDGNHVRPLPRDCNEFFRGKLAGKNPDGLSFSEVIELLKNSTDEMPVVIDDSILQAGEGLTNTPSLEYPISGLNATLYEYQNHGIAWMRRCLNITNGLILADEMGLGKTLQIIGLLLVHWQYRDAPVLIVCPTSLIANWAREIKKFAPGIEKVLIHRGPNRVRIYTKLSAAQIVITTYDTVLSDISIMRSVKWSFLIADEAQAIKNPSSQRRNALVQIPRQYSIAMTGTPIENSLKDLWSLADFAIPGILGSELEFDTLYPETDKGSSDLSKVTAPFIIKRKLRDVAADLPERIDCDIPIEIGDALSAEYENIRLQTIAKHPMAGALVATGQLQLFCAHPWLRAANTFGDDWEESIFLDHNAIGQLMTPKLELTIELLDVAFKCGKKVLVFSIFNKIGDLIQVAGGNLPAAFWGSINGSTEQERRQQIVDDFSSYDGPGILIINPKAAGAGLNITAATVVIHYTPVWNPAIEAQASARAHRRGQEFPVTVYRLYYEDTVERVMRDRTLWKTGLANDAMAIVSNRNQSDVARALSISPVLEPIYK